jgi:hypothetical protein
MDIGLFDLYTLQDLYRRIKTAPRFWLNFYQKQINFDGRNIIFEKVYGDDRKLAPFAVPTAAGRPQKLDGFEAYTLAPAYIKLKDTVDPTMHIERLPGEALGGTLTIQQRRDAVKVELLRRQKEKVFNTWNWLSARATIDGKVTISGEDYPETLIDFRRDPALTKVLTGGAAWDQSTAKPLEDLRDMRIGAQELSGARVSRHVFGANAWELFCERVDLTAMQNSLNRGAGQQVTVSTISDGYGDTIEYMGSIQGLNGQGRLEFWVDTTRYIDEAGNEQFYLDQDTVVGLSPDLMGGTRCFGAIMDAKAGFRSLDVFQKNWENEDPSVEYLLMQSAPLMVPKEPNATYKIKVK